jgi:transcriptional regulator with XRE-family HTH domain
MMTSVYDFALALQRVRYEAKETQRQFAERLGIKAWRVSDFELGRPTDTPAYRILIDKYPDLALTPPPPRPTKTNFRRGPNVKKDTSPAPTPEPVADRKGLTSDDVPNLETWNRLLDGPREPREIMTYLFGLSSEKRAQLAFALLLK